MQIQYTVSLHTAHSKDGVHSSFSTNILLIYETSSVDKRMHIVALASTALNMRVIFFLYFE